MSCWCFVFVCRCCPLKSTTLRSIETHDRRLRIQNYVKGHMPPCTCPNTVGTIARWRLFLPRHTCCTDEYPDSYGTQNFEIFLASLHDTARKAYTKEVKGTRQGAESVM